MDAEGHLELGWVVTSEFNSPLNYAKTEQGFS